MTTTPEPDQPADTGAEWRTEYRVAGMTFRRGGRVLTEASNAVPVWDAAADPDAFTHADALDMLRGLQDTRGGTLETRRVAETPWTPVEPQEEPQDPEALNEAAVQAGLLDNYDPTPSLIARGVVADPADHEAP